MNDFRRRFSTIKNRPMTPRLPRLGYIRLGLKVKKKGKQSCDCGPKDGCMFCTRPIETDYFVIPEELKAVYGEEPKTLRVMLPVDDEQAVFSQRYVFYGMSQGWKCMGDGERAERVDTESDTIIEVACPGPEKCEYHPSSKGNAQCSLQATLQVIVLDDQNKPLNDVWGVYFINTTSETSRIDITSGIRMLGELSGGRLALLPLILRRQPTVMHKDGKRRTHWTMQLIPAVPLDQLAFYRANPTHIYTGQPALPAPELIHPATQGDPVVEIPDLKDEEKGEFCEICGQSFATHADDGSCVIEVPETKEEAEGVDLGHAEGCSCEACLGVPEGFENVTEGAHTAPDDSENVGKSEEVPTKEESGDSYTLYAGLQQELADISDDSDKTADAVTQWLRDNGARLGKLPIQTDNGMDQKSVIKLANAIKKKKKAA